MSTDKELLDRLMAGRAPGLLPQKLGPDRPQEGLDGRGIAAIPGSAHGHLEAVLAQDFLIVVRTILGRINRSSPHP